MVVQMRTMKILLLKNEPIHVVNVGLNVSLNVSLNDDHQMLKYQSLDASTM